MTPGSILTFCLWICLFFCYCTETQGELAMDCCLAVNPKQVPLRLVRTLMRQKKGNGCDIDAIVVITKKNVKLCSPPEVGWVKNYITHFEKLMKICKAKKYLGQKCKDLKPAYNE